MLFYQYYSLTLFYRHEIYLQLQIIFKQFPNQHMEADKPTTQPTTAGKEHEHQKEDKTYIKSKKKWNDFKIHQDIIAALQEDDKMTPTRVQAQTLDVTVNPDRKKFNILIRAANGSGKTMSFLVPILNSLQPGLQIAQDKTFKGKVVQNEIFKPQAIILVQTNILQDQLQRILQAYAQFGATIGSQKLKFTVGRLDKEKHEPGDIIVAMPKSLANRHQRKNLKLDNCKFIAIDQVDEIFEQQDMVLAQILKFAEAGRPNIITCSATMKKEFVQFYDKHCTDVIKFNINSMVQKQLGQTITLEGVKNYYRVCESKEEMHKYVITTVFKHLYNKTSLRPQVFIFFDSIDQIKAFHDYFKARASDFTSDQSEYLKPLTVGIISAKKYEDGKKVEMKIAEKKDIMTRFRNKETSILCATNIIARGIDIRNACFVINMGPPKFSQRETDIDLDIYLHRVGRTGRHNDRGLALTLAQKNDLTRLVQGIKKVHKLEMNEMQDPAKLAQEVRECIKWNSE